MNFIEIKCLNDLLSIKSGNNYRLICDINCENIKIQNIVGDFKGVIDGCGYSIYNLILKEENIIYDSQPIALFYTMNKCVIKNLVIKNLQIDISKSSYDIRLAVLCVEASNSIFENISVNLMRGHNNIIPLIYDSNDCKYKDVKFSDNMILNKYK